METEELVLGIDFGTSNSVVAVYRRRNDGPPADGGDGDNDEDGDVEVLANDIEARVTPSCVHLQPSEKHQVGEAALRMTAIDPRNTVQNVKQILGRSFRSATELFLSPPFGSVRVEKDALRDACILKMQYPRPGLWSEEEEVTPEEAAAAILQDLRETAKLRLGQDVRRAVIGVPSYFNAAQRFAVKQAAELAGLQVDRLCDETSAAALAYARLSPKEGIRKVLVVDVGGGGGSAAVVEVQSRSVVRVLASTGARLPGGEDLDATMLMSLKDQVIHKFSRDPNSEQFKEKLRLQWKEAKKKLAFGHSSAEIKIYSEELNRDIDWKVTQQDFKRLFNDWCSGIVKGINRVMKDAGVSEKGVKDVVLVGASARFPELRSKVEQTFHQKCCRILSGDDGVAVGNALLGAGCGLVNDRTPHFTTLYHHWLRSFIRDNIPAQSILPAKYRRPYSYVPSSINYQVCQSPDAEEGKQLLFNCSLDRNHEIEISIDGLFFMRDAKNATILDPIYALSNERFKHIQRSVLQRENSHSLESERVQSKNQLEERLRRILSLLEEDKTSPFFLVNQNRIEWDLQWLEKYQNLDKKFYTDLWSKHEHLLLTLEKASSAKALAEENRLRVEAEERERRTKEILRQKQEELQRQKQEELQRQKQEELQRQKQEELQRQEAEDPLVTQRKSKEVKRSHWLSSDVGHTIPLSSKAEVTALRTFEQCQNSDEAGQGNSSSHNILICEQSQSEHITHNATPFVSRKSVTLCWTDGRTSRQIDAENIKKEAILLMRGVYKHHIMMTSSEQTQLWIPPDYSNLSPLGKKLVQNPGALLQLIAEDTRVEVLKQAFNNRYVAMLTGKVHGSGDYEFIYLAVRYVSGQEPVECLLALVDSSMTGHDLFNYFNELCSKASVSWKDALIGVSVDGTLACNDLYHLLKRERTLTRIWNSSHRLDDKIAQECYKHVWGKQFFSMIDAVIELFGKEKWFKVLKEHCTFVVQNNLETYEQVINLLSRTSNRMDVVKALNKIQTIDPKTFLQINAIKSCLSDNDFVLKLLTFFKVLSVMKGTSEILKFPSDIDLETIDNCLESLQDYLFWEEIENDASTSIQRKLTRNERHDLANILSTSTSVLKKCIMQCSIYLHDYLMLKGECGHCKTFQKYDFVCNELHAVFENSRTPSDWLSICEVDHPAAYDRVLKLMTMPLVQPQENKTVLELQCNLKKSFTYLPTYLEAIFILKSTSNVVAPIINPKKIINGLNHSCN